MQFGVRLVELPELAGVRIVDPDKTTFGFFNCEQLFRDVWDGYFADAMDEKWITARVEQAVESAKAKRPRSESELAGLRVYPGRPTQVHDIELPPDVPLFAPGFEIDGSSEQDMINVILRNGVQTPFKSTTGL